MSIESRASRAKEIVDEARNAAQESGIDTSEFIFGYLGSMCEELERKIDAAMACARRLQEQLDAK